MCLFCLYLAVAMPLARPKAKARVSPYAHQLRKGGVARPVRPVPRLPPLAPGLDSSDSVELQQEAVVWKQRAGRSEVAGTFKARSGCLPAGRGSARAAEDKEWNKWAEKWCVELAPVLECSPSFAGLDKELASASLSRVLQRSAAGTLRKHFPGWRLWKSFASGHGWEGGGFSQSQL